MAPTGNTAAALACAALLAASCTHVRSGRYVRVGPGETLAALAREHGAPPARLLAANGGRPPKPGTWYFVPLDRGILPGRGGGFHPGLPGSYLSSGNLIWPVPSSKRISSSFGRRWGRPHQGIDIPGREGAAVIAVADGRVVHAGRLGGYGNVVVLFHPEFDLFSIYAHNRTNHVRAGRKVHKGQVIAALGSTGRATGPHLHLEIRRNSRPLDPAAYVYKRW